MIIYAIDENEDKSLSETEFQTMLAAFGHPKLDAKFNHTFSTFGSKDGLVPIGVIVDNWVDFLTSTNESKAEIARKLDKLEF